MTRADFKIKFLTHKYIFVSIIILVILIPISIVGYQFYLYSQSSLPENLSGAEQMKRQAAADQDFSKGMREREEVYPWADQLPIQKENYFVYFDFDKKQFKAKIYPQKSSSVSVDVQTKNYKEEIEKQLKAISPDTAKYNRDWVIIPE